MILRTARSFWFRLLVTVVVLGVLVTRIDLPSTVAALLRLRLPYALAVIALVALDRGVMMGRWILLLRAGGQQVPAGPAARVYLVSSFLGGFLPAGVGADVVRAYAWTQRTSQPGEAVASVAVDRLLGLLSLVVMGLFGLLVWAPELDDGLWEAWVAAALLGVAAAAALFWADRGLRAAVSLSERAARPVTRLLHLGDALGRYRGHGRALTLVFALSIAVQVLRIVQAYLLGVGIGIPVSLTAYLAFMPIGLLVLLLPVSISGFGIPQGVIVWLLGPHGVPGPDAFALSTLIVLSGVLANLPGAWLWVRRRPADSTGDRGQG